MLKFSVCCSLAVLLSASIAMPQSDPSKPVRARDLGVPFDGTPGPINAITEMTGTAWVEESGLLEGPIGITNTHSVGVVRDTTIQWLLSHHMSRQPWALPVVAETWDGWLNDLNGFHVKPEDVFAALDSAASGPVAEGNTGGGTGMICYGFKGGTGTSSRVLTEQDGGYTVGVLVQCNCGARRLLTIAGVAVGKEIPMERDHAAANPPGYYPCRGSDP